MPTFVLVAAIIIMLVGVAGTILPFIPGVPLVFVAIAAYGWYDGFQHVTANYVVIMAGLAVLSLLVDYLATTLGAKYYGSSRAGVIGALVGTVLGLFIFPPLGIILFPWLGAVIGELVTGKDWEPAMKAGIGTIIGLFSGMVFKAVLALAMVISFIIVIF